MNISCFAVINRFTVSVNLITLTVSRLTATKHEMFTDYVNWGLIHDPYN